LSSDGLGLGINSISESLLFAISAIFYPVSAPEYFSGAKTVIWWNLETNKVDAVCQRITVNLCNCHTLTCELSHYHTDCTGMHNKYDREEMKREKEY
jgi:hypothetical protein